MFYSAQRLDLFTWCVRLSRLLVGFRTHLKLLHFYFMYSSSTGQWPTILKPTDSIPTQIAATEYYKRI